MFGSSGHFLKDFLSSYSRNLIIDISFHLFDYKFSTEHGKFFGLVMLGEAIFTVMFIMASLKIFVFANSYSILLLTVMVLSILSGYLTWLVLHQNDFGVLEHSFTRLGSSIQYLAFGFVVFGLFVFDYGLTKLWGTFRFIFRQHCFQKVHSPANTKRVSHSSRGQCPKW